MATSTERVRKLRASRYKIEANLDEQDQHVLVEIRRMCGDLPDATIIRRALLAYQRDLMRASVEALG